MQKMLVHSFQKLYSVVVAAVLLLIALNIGADYLYALFQSTGFYFSESFLFSTFWLLAIPLLYYQWKYMANWKLMSNIVQVLLLSIIHLLFYPIWIWLLSAITMEHRFAYTQTLQFGITAYGIKALFVYSIPLIISQIKSGRKKSQHTSDAASLSKTDTIWVSDHAHTKIALPVSAILCIQSSSPYVSIYTATKKYLYNATLKDMQMNLFSEPDFVRIHKSCIVQAVAVSSYTSRQNGDYDLQLSNGMQVRMSRNYAKALKLQLGITQDN